MANPRPVSGWPAYGGVRVPPSHLDIDRGLLEALPKEKQPIT